MEKLGEERHLVQQRQVTQFNVYCSRGINVCDITTTDNYYDKLNYDNYNLTFKVTLHGDSRQWLPLGGVSSQLCQYMQ